MIIICSNCNTKYSISKRVLGNNGKKVKCFKCKQSGHFAKYCPGLYKKAIYINSHKPWSPEEDQQLANELDSNLSIKEISDIHKRTYNAIKSGVDKVEHLRSNGENNGNGKDINIFGIIRIILACFSRSKNKEDDQESLIHDDAN